MSAIDDYLSKLDKPQRQALDNIRKITMQLVPGAEETTNYGIPTLRYKDKNLIHFAAFKNHMSLFPGPKPIEALRTKLGAYKLSKGTIWFTVDNPIPEDIIKEIIAIRLKTV